MRKVLTWMKGHKVKTTLIFTFVILSLIYLFVTPTELFVNTPYSTVVLSKEGRLLGAKISEDGQWRFPPSGKVPEKFKMCLIEFEDRHFYSHHGVHLPSIARAIRDNFSAGKTVSGASTITMQLVRLDRREERTLWQKAMEAIIATRLELKYTKDEILALYASHAPFGGNVVGLEAAAWRYFGIPAEDLSWGEAATLAILPNAPTSTHLSKNREALLKKRNRLLERLYKRNVLDSITFALACEEPLPQAPMPLPQCAPHLVQNHFKHTNGGTIHTSIDYNLQNSTQAIVDRWNTEFSSSGVKDLAAVIIDVHSGKILSYVGNAHPESEREGSKVDIVSSPRSTGSLLKPILYCALMQDGAILPHTLLPDTPININGFSPQNFDMTFSGAVPASIALSRSLNVPSVHMLRTFGVPRFYNILKNCGMSTLFRDPSDYGLSLILGGLEGNLQEMTRMYAMMSAYYQGIEWKENTLPKWPLTDKMALYSTFEALREVNRPDEMDWKMVPSLKKIAWKTGTSYGYRDGWSIGITPDYAVGVWCGNAAGEGCPILVGARTAAPVMFDIFNILPDGEWFSDPDPEDYIYAEVCPESGHLKGQHCPQCDTVALARNALRSSPCPYHKSITMEGKWRTSKPGINSHIESYFILPPAMEWFYRQRHPEYRSLPPMKPDEGATSAITPMGFIYPENGSKILVPRKLDGTMGEIVFNLAHSNPETEVFWHLDDKYIGSTKHIHQLSIRPDAGSHYMTVVDKNGNQLSVRFSCHFSDKGEQL